MTNPTDREEGALSELGDKERRFVEDQRKVDVGMLRAMCDFPVVGPLYASVETDYPVLIQIRNAMPDLLDELEHKDALLAEAAEVLRGMGSVLFDHYESEADCNSDAKHYWENRVYPLLVRAKPLLDKLEDNHGSS